MPVLVNFGEFSHILRPSLAVLEAKKSAIVMPQNNLITRKFNKPIEGLLSEPLKFEIFDLFDFFLYFGGREASQRLPRASGIDIEQLPTQTEASRPTLCHFFGEFC